jgi:uncharacterized phiE125 gp8 family phage protein
MNTERTPINGNLPVTLAEAKALSRVTHTAEDALITDMIRTAAADVEAMTGLALLSTTITHTTVDKPGLIINLPVGPVLAGAVATVLEVAQDGSTAAASGFWLEAGRYPRLHFTSTPAGPLRITYTAGYGADENSVPRDLAGAICEQAARLYDQRGGVTDKGPALSAHAARVIARYRRVKL